MRSPTNQQLIIKLNYLSDIVSVPAGTWSCVVWGEVNMFGFAETTENAINNLLDCLKEYDNKLKGELEEGECYAPGTTAAKDIEILHKFFNW